MRRPASSLHLFLTLLLMLGLLLGAFGPNLVSALGVNPAPTPQSFMRQTPATSPTNADTLTFRVTFTEAVTGVDAADFVVHDNTPDPTTNAPGLTVTAISTTVYDVKIYGGDLSLFDGVVGLDFSTTAAITDTSSNPIVISEPATDETYLVDNSNPTVFTFLQAAGQSDPATTQPVNFQVVFSESINAGTFTASDITQGGDAPPPVWIITQVDNKTFDLSAATTGNGSIIPLIPAGRVNDTAGNGNDPFIKSCNVPADNFDHCVTLADNIRPTVTIDQASGQADPTNILPVNFTVVFSELVNASTFTASDITQAGTSPSPVWNVADSGDHKTFNLTVTSVSGNGTLIPVIVAGRVLDLVGNDNTLSGGVDNSVTFMDSTGPTVTIEQASGQADPTGALPIKFTVKFSEPILASTFTAADITQTGTSTGIVWGISSTDNITFTLTAIINAGTSYGFLVPTLPLGKVTDIFGNPNDASTSIDNSVEYKITPATKTPTPTATPPQVPYKDVVITEVAWMGSSASSSDEWIELYNTTNHAVNLEGWELRSFKWSGTATDGKWVLNLDIKFTSADIIQPRESTDPKDTSGYFLLQRGFSSTDYNAVWGISGGKPGQIKIYTNYLLTDTGEVLLLCSSQNMDAGVCEVNNKSQLVDYVNASWTGSGYSNPWPAGKGSSLYGTMERKNLISDEDTNWFPHPANPPRYGHDRNWNGTTASGNLINGTPLHPNWSSNVTATPRATATSTRTPTPQAVAAPLLVLNEVLPRAGSDWNNDGKVDVYDEFIEVMNTGSVNLDLKNYKLDDALNAGSAPFPLPSLTLKPGEKAVFYGSQTGIRLEDSGDTVRLIRASNNGVLDSVTYPVVKSVDSSICRYTDGYGSWLTNCFPTPGLPNALTGERSPSTSSGSPILVCYLPDSVPDEFVLAECGEEGSGIWNYNYWDSFPGEGKQIWQVDPDDKWLVVYQ